jgi:hypothetical protein
MHRSLFILDLLAAVGSPPLARGQAPDDPRLVVRAALRAVEGDSVASLRARWQSRLDRTPGDRAAAAAAGLAAMVLVARRRGVRS